jgi:hypothetical protein
MNGFAGKQFCRMLRKPGKMIEEPAPGGGDSSIPMESKHFLFAR